MRWPKNRKPETSVQTTFEAAAFNRSISARLLRRRSRKPSRMAFGSSRRPRPSFSGRRTISFSLAREEKLICRICPKPKCIDSKPGTSPSRIASTTFQKTCVAFTGIGLHPKPGVSIPALRAVYPGGLAQARCRSSAEDERASIRQITPFNVAQTQIVVATREERAMIPKSVGMVALSSATANQPIPAAIIKRAVPARKGQSGRPLP